MLAICQLSHNSPNACFFFIPLFVQRVTATANIVLPPYHPDFMIFPRFATILPTSYCSRIAYRQRSATITDPNHPAAATSTSRVTVGGTPYIELARGSSVFTGLQLSPTRRRRFGYVSVFLLYLLEPYSECVAKVVDFSIK